MWICHEYHCRRHYLKLRRQQMTMIWICILLHFFFLFQFIGRTNYPTFLVLLACQPPRVDLLPSRLRQLQGKIKLLRKACNNPDLKEKVRRERPADIFCDPI